MEISSVDAQSLIERLLACPWEAVWLFVYLLALGAVLNCPQLRHEEPNRSCCFGKTQRGLWQRGALRGGGGGGGQETTGSRGLLGIGQAWALWGICPAALMSTWMLKDLDVSPATLAGPECGLRSLLGADGFQGPQGRGD